MSFPFTLVTLGPEAEEVVAELAVLRALEAAGKRARLARAHMTEARDHRPTHEVHVRFKLAHNREAMDRLLCGLWDHLQLVLDPGRASALARVCDGYVRELIAAQQPHRRDQLHLLLVCEREAMEYRGATG